MTIKITAIKDLQFCNFTPNIRDPRGLTFYVSDACRARICIHDVRVPDSEVQRNPEDEAGEQSIGIEWFGADHTDYTAWTLAAVNRFFSY